MKRAALLGDGWMPYLYSARRYAASAETVRRVAAEAGRDLDGFGWYLFVFVNVDPDGDRARDGQPARWAGTTGRTSRRWSTASPSPERRARSSASCKPS